MPSAARPLTGDRIARLRELYADAKWYENDKRALGNIPRTADPERTEDTAADLFDSILEPVLALVKRKISQVLVEKGNLTKKEQPLTELSENDSDLPIKLLELDFGAIRSFRSAKELHAEQRRHPNFEWPRRAAEQLERKELLILDLRGVKLRVEFADGVEFKLPIKNPLLPL